MQEYNPKEIEAKWQKYWEENKIFSVTEDSEKQKFYSLIEFPYPSGDGLHVGHPRPFTAMDVISRKKRMQGYNVLYPIGFDAFGLPTENYAIKHSRPPAEVTAENIATFTRQLKALGFSFDWSRVVDTTDPNYYKWTQWIFLQLFKHGLAYKKNIPINWCLSCKIGLANEEVVEGKCERCGGEVEMRDKEQWMLAITKYAESLLEGLDDVDYIERAKVQQKNWIGRSEGASVIFSVIASDRRECSNPVEDEIATSSTSSPPRNGSLRLEVFTTRPDTLFGATYMVLAPEHELVEKLQDKISNWKEVESYIKKAKKKSDLERTELQKEKTGVELKGVKAINPVNNEEIPIWVADYVLISYGTGAIMAVPAHDERDWEFAKEYGIKIREVVLSGGSVQVGWERKKWSEEWNDWYAEPGKNINSDFLNGLTTEEAKEKMIVWLEEKGLGKKEVNYKLRDWVFSRQRYWGEPIPLVYCEACAKEKEQVLILHGWEDDSESGFIPSLKADLENKGYIAFAFDAPDTEEPKFDVWFEFIENKIKENNLENFSLVGHSMGGHLALKLAEKYKVKELILVAPVGFSPDAKYFDKFSGKLSNKEISIFKDYQNRKLDINKVKNNIKRVEFLFGENDPWVTQEIRDFYVSNFEDMAEIRIIAGAGHLSSDEGVKRIQEVEDLFVEKKTVTGWIPLPEDQLPLELPKVEKYEPTDTGESPLAVMEDWIKTTCPKCGGEARRETDTMPNWAGSSWYFLRYMDPHNNKEFASQDKLKYWGPIDWYNGGMEHTVLHLLYSRFWNQFLFDIGAVPFKEPYKKRTSHGMILAKGGEKMSKSKGNVINPDEMIEKFGADALRTYIMFMGPFDQAVEWDTNGLVGVKRFLDKIWNLQGNLRTTNFVRKYENTKLDNLIHRTIKKVTEDIDKMHFNTAIAKMMELVNEMGKQEEISIANYQLLISILSPFAPHICTELWEQYGEGEMVWPDYDEELIQEDVVTLVVQVNGKVRASLEVSADISEDEAKEKALAEENVQKWLEGKEPKKVICVQGKLVSVVT